MSEPRLIYAEPEPEPEPVRVGAFYAFPSSHHLIVGEVGKPSITVPDDALAPLAALAGRLAEGDRKP